MDYFVYRNFTTENLFQGFDIGFSGYNDISDIPAAKNYMIEEMFEEKNIDITYFDYSNYPEYPQLYNEFSHAVTILDMIFNLGEETINYMKSFINK